MSFIMNDKTVLHGVHLETSNDNFMDEEHGFHALK